MIVSVNCIVHCCVHFCGLWTCTYIIYSNSCSQTKHLYEFHEPYVKKENKLVIQPKSSKSVYVLIVSSLTVWGSSCGSYSGYPRQMVSSSAMKGIISPSCLENRSKAVSVFKEKFKTRNICNITEVALELKFPYVSKLYFTEHVSFLNSSLSDKKYGVLQFLSTICKHFKNFGWIF